MNFSAIPWKCAWVASLFLGVDVLTLVAGDVSAGVYLFHIQDDPPFAGSTR